MDGDKSWSAIICTCFWWAQCMFVCVFVRSCTYFLQPCGQPAVAVVGGTAGRLITESEETSHPPPLFIPGLKWSEACCSTHTHSWMSYKKTKLKKRFGVLTRTIQNHFSAAEWSFNKKTKNFTSFVFYKCHLKEAEPANIDICIVTDFFRHQNLRQKELRSN